MFLFCFDFARHKTYTDMEPYDFTPHYRFFFFLNHDYDDDNEGFSAPYLRDIYIYIYIHLFTTYINKVMYSAAYDVYCTCFRTAYIFSLPLFLSLSLNIYI